MTRVVLAEDQGMMRGALATLLDLEEDLEVVAQVGRGDLVLEAVRTHDAEVAVLDIEMPGASGLDAAQELRQHCPACAVVVVTTYGRPGYVRRALAAGVRGFVIKDRPVEQLADTIRRVRAGETVVDPQLAAAALAYGDSPLTERERHVLAASGGGASNADLARSLHLSESTVRNYLSNAIGKLGAHNRTEAHHLARDAGWL